MTDFQVGDRVSVEGVITYINERGTAAEVEGSSGGRSDIVMADLTLVERPKRKLRVGSVWEHNGSCRYVYLGDDWFSDWRPDRATVARVELNIDTSPALWREVPVEELAREVEP